MIDPAGPDFTDTPVAPGRPAFGYSPADPEAAPAISIVTPYFDTGPLFHETAASVFGQSFQRWEWLIVNDGSTDPEALAVLETYRNRDPRVRVLDQPSNRGPSAARNSAFLAARCEFVLQIDSDNLLEPTALEKWYWFLQSYPEYSFVKGYTVGFGAKEYLWPRGFHSGDLFLEHNQVDLTSMVRRSVHQAVGGYDETIRGGFEDWDFWLKCADSGHWGATIPEFHDWYRRRPAHSDRWPTWDEGRQQAGFRALLRKRYPALWKHGLPRIEVGRQEPYAEVADELPCDHPMTKNKPRLLAILPWLTMGGADKFNLDLVRQLTGLGWQISIATTLPGAHHWLPEFSRLTPDVFVLQHFLRPRDYPRFLRSLIRSRRVDTVLLSNSQLGYLLLPYLRAHFPEVTFLDYCHIEEEYWNNGGYPRLAVQYQDLLDLNVVSSEHLKGWMVERGADRERIEVCTTNVDCELWRPDTEARLAERAELDLDDSVPMILFAGRICSQKQPAVLAKTLLRLHRAGASFRAVVAGDGPDLAWLRSFVNKHRLNRRVQLVGEVSNQRVRRLMRAADVFFLPSSWEGIALSIFEAMASGLTVVAADVGGQRELVTVECGVLVSAGDELEQVERYTEELTELLLRPERRARMGAAARARVRAGFQLDDMGRRMSALADRAASLRIREPRPTPDPGLGRAVAFQAVEYTRVADVSHRLWLERNDPAPQVRVFRILQRHARPLLRYAEARGWTWLPRLADRVKKVLLRQPDNPNPPADMAAGES